MDAKSDHECLKVRVALICRGGALICRGAAPVRLAYTPPRLPRSCGGAHSMKGAQDAHCCSMGASAELAQLRLACDGHGCWCSCSFVAVATHPRKSRHLHRRLSSPLQRSFCAGTHHGCLPKPTCTTPPPTPAAQAGRGRGAGAAILPRDGGACAPRQVQPAGRGGRLPAPQRRVQPAQRVKQLPRWSWRLWLGAGVLHCGEVATAHGTKKSREKQWPGLTGLGARPPGPHYIIAFFFRRFG